MHIPNEVLIVMNHLDLGSTQQLIQFFCGVKLNFNSALLTSSVILSNGYSMLIWNINESSSLVHTSLRIQFHVKIFIL